MIVRVVAFALILVIGFVLLYRFLNQHVGEAKSEVMTYELKTQSSTLPDFLPLGDTGEIVRHRHYTLSYDESHEQAVWVAYQLTEASLRIPNVPRRRRYEVDDAVSSFTASYHDYTRSGYTRGHLAPAGDMAFDSTAMRESFFMSNIAPQKRAFNGGVWRELEESVRDWAYHNDELYVVTGPVFEGQVNHIGRKNQIRVPSAFFKIVLDHSGPDRKAIGFVIPNALSDQPLPTYAVSVDEIEQRTGLDFFPHLLKGEEEARLESTVDVGQWKFSDKRFRLRLSKWNHE